MVVIKVGGIQAFKDICVKNKFTSGGQIHRSRKVYKKQGVKGMIVVLFDVRSAKDSKKVICFYDALVGQVTSVVGFMVIKAYH